MTSRIFSQVRKQTYSNHMLEKMACLRWFSLLLLGHERKGGQCIVIWASVVIMIKRLVSEEAICTGSYTVLHLIASPGVSASDFASAFYFVCLVDLVMQFIHIYVRLHLFMCHLVVYL